MAEDAEIVRVHGPVLRASQALTRGFGSPWAVFGLAIGTVVWLAAGTATGYPREWEVVATVGLPILALLALFVVQHTQNHNDRALQLKLDELLRAIETADDRLVAVEDVDEQGLHELRATYRHDLGAADGGEGAPGDDADGAHEERATDESEPPVTLGARVRAGFRGSANG